MAGRQRAFSIANLLPSRRNSGFFPDPSKSIHISALNNDVEGVKLIIRKEKTALNSVDPSTGQTGEFRLLFIIIYTKKLKQFKKLSKQRYISLSLKGTLA